MELHFSNEREGDLIIALRVPVDSTQSNRVVLARKLSKEAMLEHIENSGPDTHVIVSGRNNIKRCNSIRISTRVKIDPQALVARLCNRSDN